MAITVTATASGSGAINGLFLAVRVLNNAALTQSGSVAQSVTATKPQLPITPGTSGSLVYGVAAVGTSGTAFSSLLANTTSIFASSLVGGEYWGAYRSSAATTTSPTTYGWGNPTETSGTLFVACAEIQSNGSTLTEDASTPAVASSGAAKTVTTASFTPPAGSVLVALVGSNWSGSSTLTQAVTDSAGAYTWTPLVQASASAQVSVVWVGIPAGTTVNAGLAQATATALAPAPNVLPVLSAAAATAAAQAPVPDVIAVPAAATATAAAQAPSVSASGTAAPPVATAAAAALAPGPRVIVTPAAATATATAQAPVTVTGEIATPAAATATATALAPSLVISPVITPGLAQATATALAPVAVVQPAAGHPSATAAALAPGHSVTVTPAVAHATATAQAPAAGPRATPAAATATAAAQAPGKSVTAQPAAASATAQATDVAYALPLSHWGVTFAEQGLGAVLTVPDLGASLAVLSPDATLSVATLNGVITGGSMQQASLTLAEFNDMTIDLAITNNGAPFNLTGYTVNLLLKAQAGDPDESALVFSSGGVSPAITITSASQGLATAQLPNDDLDTEAYNFYRLDVVNSSSQQQTTAYGPITWITL